MLQTAGGWGIAAIAIYAYLRKDKELAALNKELRGSMLENTVKLAEVIADNTHTAKALGAEFKDVRRLLPGRPRNDLDDGSGPTRR